ncbi:MAG: hypothetical protein ACRD6N_19580, partial [Pyrinomonadaceae bacterium]
ILFFITPHIYRPDYQGRPLPGAASTGPRTITIPQPVPLGNPPSNTPTPTQLQQQEDFGVAPPGTQPRLLSAPAPNLPPTQSNPTARPGTLGGQRP